MKSIVSRRETKKLPLCLLQSLQVTIYVLNIRKTNIKRRHISSKKKQRHICVSVYQKMVLVDYFFGVMISISSTSKVRSELGGIALPAPDAP